MIARALNLILSLALAFNGAYVFAAPTDAEPLIGAPYFKSCEGLLAAIKAGETEKFFLHQVATDAERLQFLLDYDLFLNAMFVSALVLVLKQNVPDRDGAKATNKMITYLKSLLAKSDRELLPLSQAVIGSFRELTAAGLPEENSARVGFLRTTQALNEIASSPDRDNIELVYTRVLRQVLLKTLRETLQQKAESLRHGSPVKVAFIAGGILAPTLFANFEYFPQGAGHDLTDFVLVSLSGGAIGGALVGMSKGLADVIRSERIYSRANKLPVLDVLTVSGGSETTIVSAFETDVPKRVTVRTIDDLAAYDISTFSPAELSYLGHLDLLNLEEAAKRTQNSLSQASLRQAMEKAQVKARDLRAEPSSIPKQMIFMASLNDLRRQTVDDPQAQKNALVEKIATVTKLIQEIKQKPYAMYEEDLTPARLLNSEFMLLKLNSDLLTLQELRFNQVPFDQFVDQVKLYVDRMQTLAAPAPETDSAWKNLADESLLTLDEMKAKFL